MKNLLLILLLSAAVFGDSGKSVLSGNGSFVFGLVGEKDGSKYMLDTNTGRLWTIYTNKNDGVILVPVEYVQIAGEKKGSLLPF